MAFVLHAARCTRPGGTAAATRHRKAPARLQGGEIASWGFSGQGKGIEGRGEDSGRAGHGGSVTVATVSARPSVMESFGGGYLLD